MCYLDRSDFCRVSRRSVIRKELFVKKHAKKKEMENWIAQDEAAGVSDYSQSLQKWRNDLMPRLKWNIPGVIRIPKCFAKALKLPSQKVRIAADFSVWTIEHKDSEDQVIPERQLVPAAAIG